MDVDLAGFGSSGPLRGHLARPAGDGPWPGVVVVHEVWGLNDVVRRQADRLAAGGYVALAPDLFTDGGARRCLVRTLREIVRSEPGRGLADVRAARAYLAASPDCSGRLGIIGFCLGGAFALLAAPHGFDVASDNYGYVPRSPDPLRGACPVVAAYGGRDRLSRVAVPRLRSHLAELGVEHDVHVYPAAGHSFLNDVEVGSAPGLAVQRVLGIGPEPESAARAWGRIEKFFDRQLRP